ncbi:MFS transporter [Nocardia sp. alder85J]|uniref:MFS transporter n=1 Tax=Nocardia sp. alder85J TaxID=2862949 RepID=UPI001CD73147|nr:MFS transporter [Nocardia sp. alder85J]MCX4091630.1 MFS transporter [Nocardia sp. alder85J]
MTPPPNGFRAFVILWCGQFLSLIGSGLSGFALGVYVYQITGSAATLGLIFALAALPFLLAAPFAGALVDRWGARRALLVGNSGALLVMLTLAALLHTGAFAPWQMIVIVAALSMVSALTAPAFDAAVPLLVPKDQIGRANGMRLVALATSQGLGPVIAGFLLLALGIDGIVLIDCVSFGCGIVSLLFVVIPRVRPRDTATAAGLATLLADFRLAWRYIAARRGLVALLAFMAALEFCAGFVDLLINPLVLAFASSGALGAVLSIGGAGMIAASVAMTVWSGPRRRVRALLGFSMLLAAATVLGSLRPSLPLVALAAVIFLGGLAVVIACNRAIWQTKVEPQLLGRAMALQGMVASVPQLIAFALAGWVSGNLFLPLAGRRQVRSPLLSVLVGHGPDRGYALLLMVIGILLAVCVTAAWQYPRLRRLEHELPDVTTADLADPAVAQN